MQALGTHALQSLYIEFINRSIYKSRGGEKSDKETSAQARVSLYDFSPPDVFCLNCLLKSRKYYGMRCGKTSGIMTMSCQIPTRVVIYQLYVA